MEKIFDVFLQYGWLGLISVIVCIILIIVGKYALNKQSSKIKSGLEDVGKSLTTQMASNNKELVNQISAQNENLVNTIVTQQNKLLDHIISGKDNEKHNHNKMLEKRIELSDEISSSLKDIGLLHNTQRAFILEFHNSYQNLSGTPFAKYSCTYEWFDKGIEPIQFKCIDMPFSSISHIVTQIIKSRNQQIVYETMEQFQEACPSLYALLKDERTQTVVYTAMYDKNNRLIGLLCLEYHYKPDNINLNRLHIKAAELTSILNLRYKYSN